MPDLIADLWSEKHRILADIWDLTQHQYAYVEDNQIDGLLDILARKQTLLVRLQHLDDQLKYYENQKALDGDAHSASEIAEILRGCRELLEKIVRVEQECQIRLENRRDAIARELSQLHEMSRARVAYTGGNSITGGQLDLTL
ncbi:flagellar export chaperone FlgN [Thermogutta sp.]|uniref:flagellar export chaperone FlgN n=1 Tax=Thermogutta sp. TaxID=1962930 RepID=UPI003C7BA481